ncbi:hypothetical protein [Pseudomonas sp. CGJS7]|uniref:hypothetical protein n=1 Tax=Pseudomonas sp. CGJS7 TaxID=3109348 RepID=UPI00300A2AC0
MSDWVLAALPQLAFAVPGMLLYVLGISLCLARRRSLGVASTYASLGFGLLLLGALLGAGAQLWLGWMVQDGHAGSSLSMRMTAMGIVRTVVSLTGTIALLAAILARRPAPDA